MSEDQHKTRAIETIQAHLADLRANRPSVRLAGEYSAKGANTVCQILGAAHTVFLRDGHAGLSMRKVADEAGLAVGNVNYYFSTKRDLVDAMLREVLADYAEAHTRQFEADRDAPLEILLNVIDFYVVNAHTSHNLFFQIWGFAGGDDNAKALIREVYRPIGRFIYYLVRAIRPDADDLEVRQIVLQLFSLEEGVKLFIGIGPDDDRALATAQQHIRIAAKRIVCGAS